MEYAAAASGEAFGEYVDTIRNETEEQYRERVLGNGRDRVLHSLVEEARVLEVTV
jgi:hypothetical protein